MRILYVLDFEPFVEDIDGLTKIYYNLIKQISTKIDVDLLIITDNRIDKKMKDFYGVNNIYYETCKLSSFRRNINRLSFEHATTLPKRKVQELALQEKLEVEKVLCLIF